MLLYSRTTLKNYSCRYYIIKYSIKCQFSNHCYNDIDPELLSLIYYHWVWTIIALSVIIHKLYSFEFRFICTNIYKLIYFTSKMYCINESFS